MIINLHVSPELIDFLPTKEKATLVKANKRKWFAVKSRLSAVENLYANKLSFVKIKQVPRKSVPL